MSRMLHRLIGMAVVVLSCVQPAKALTVHFVWDPTVGGSYRLIGLSTTKPADMVGKSEPGGSRVDLPPGEYRLTGVGIDTSFDVENEELHFKSGPGASLKWDKTTGTMTFNAAVLKVDLNGYEQPVTILGITSKPLDKTRPLNEIKLVCGKHKLEYGGGILAVDIDAGGAVTLPDNPGGFSVQGNILTLHPREFTVEVSAGVANFNIGGPLGTSGAAGTTKVKLLPTSGQYDLRFSTAPGKGQKVELHIDSMGRLAFSDSGPFTEYLQIKADGTGEVLMALGLPGGKELAAAREAKEAAAAKLFEQISKDSISASKWHQDFAFDDAMQTYPFPEQLISYRVQFPAGKIKATDLVLVSLNDQKAQTLPLQLSDVVETNGFLGEATVSFRADLPIGAARLYRLAAGYAAPKLDANIPSIAVEKNADGTAWIKTDMLALQVPQEKQEFPAGKKLADVPAPILGIKRADGPDALLAGMFVAPPELKVTTVQGTVLENGPLFLKYRVSYQFWAGKSYDVTLTLRTGDNYVTVDEALNGLAIDDQAFWRMNFTGLKPTARQTMSGGGYPQYSGAYGKDVDSDGKLPLELGINTPNALGVMHSAAFWNDDAPDGVLLCTYRLRDWKTAKRYVWYSRGPGMLQFFDKAGEQYFQARLEGHARYWALAVLPREQIVNRPVVGWPDPGPGAGPEVRLFQKLTDFSLNMIKDRVVDWDESSDPGMFADQKEITFNNWIKYYGIGSHFAFLTPISNLGWDSAGNVAAPTFRGMSERFGQYARSRANWSPEQRRQARAILLFLAYASEDDNNIPHHGMLGGHPNFVMDVKTTIPIACATFPNHPDAKKWRDSFMAYYKEWIDTYQRSDDPAHNALGGRWTENIACYSGQALTATLLSHDALKAFDGTDLINTEPRMVSWLRWYRDAMMSPHDGQRMVPPQGAHARLMEPGGAMWQSLCGIADRIAKSQPELSAQMKWIKTNGKEGVNPKVKSALYVDYGPIMHYDMGGPHESYAHLQDIAGNLNYRWSGAGIVYYGAKGKIWSYNGDETNGDDFSWDKVSAFSIDGNGLKPGPTDGVLYDFGDVQYYRAASSADSPKYKARSIMLVRDDYLVILDEVADDATAGQFVWACTYDMPQIYQLKPGAPAINQTASDPAPHGKGAPPSSVSKIAKFVGKGDFLTVVAPEKLDATAEAFGAVVNGEYVFASAKPVDVKQGPVVFTGTSGYARENEIAIFNGTRVGYQQLTLSRDGGDFGVSAVLANGEVNGRIVGREGGKITLAVPGVDINAAKVSVDGKPVQATSSHGQVMFSVNVTQSQGSQSYRIVFR